MDKRALTVIIASLLVIASASAVLFSDGSFADSKEFNPTGKVSNTKELTFTGKVHYNVAPEDGGEPYIIVLIGTIAWDPAYSEGRLSYVVEPSKSQIGSDGTFSVRSYRAEVPGLDYYFLIESGYEIDNTSSSLNGTPSTVYRYNYTTRDPLTGSESYSAFKLIDTVEKEDTTVKITGKNGPYDMIGTTHTTGTLFVTVVDNNYKLSNVEIRLVREGEDSDEYYFSDHTEKDGTCIIKNVSTGVYNLIAVNENYEQFKDIQVVITKGNTTSITVEMNAIVTEGEYWGYDLPHFLMLCAGSACIIIIATSIAIYRKSVKGKGGEWIDDVEDDDE